LRQQIPELTQSPQPVTLRSYPTIRNLQLLVPHILGAEKIIALDDDEIVSPDYVRRAAVGLPRFQRALQVRTSPHVHLPRAHLAEIPRRLKLRSSELAATTETLSEWSPEAFVALAARGHELSVPFFRLNEEGKMAYTVG